MVNIAEVGISSSHTLNRIDRKLTHKILEADIFKHLVTKGVKCSVLIGLGHLGVSIGALDPAVGRNKLHPDRSIGGSVGDYFVCFMYLFYRVTVLICIGQEFMPTASAFRGLCRPEGRGHASEIRKPCGGGIHRDAVSLDDTG